jgi:glycosyltransferase involved in cell wall biosynthesis
MTKLLTIGMSTFDDFDGVYFSVQALRLYHPILNNIDYEILVIDNNPDSPHGKEVKSFITNWTNGKGVYIPYTTKSSTSVRNEIFKNAKGKYSISIDCHVLIKSGGIEALLQYYQNNPECKNIVQGPLIYDDLHNYSTEFAPVWRDHMYGVWHTNKAAMQNKKPFTIPMMGLGLFSCETKNWPGFNELFKGFGGEEGYIHEKFRLNGGETICLPELGWVHRFGRPNGVKYRLVLEDRIWNYYIGWLELTKDPNHIMVQGITDHFKDKISTQTLDTLLNNAKKALNIKE